MQTNSSRSIGASPGAHRVSSGARIAACLSLCCLWLLCCLSWLSVLPLFAVPDLVAVLPLFYSVLLVSVYTASMCCLSLSTLPLWAACLCLHCLYGLPGRVRLCAASMCAAPFRSHAATNGTHPLPASCERNTGLFSIALCSWLRHIAPPAHKASGHRENDNICGLRAL